ncbi:MAG: glycosyltransferase family 4 protein [Chloroflexota bacterium]
MSARREHFRQTNRHRVKCRALSLPKNTPVEVKIRMPSKPFFFGSDIGPNASRRSDVALANALAERGAPVTIIAVHSKTLDPTLSPNLKILRWPKPAWNRLRHILFFDQLTRQEHPVAIVANFGAVNIMLLVGMLRRVPVRIAWHRTLSAQYLADAKSPAWVIRLLIYRKRLFYKMATHLIANSEAALNDLRDVFKVPSEKCVVFHNATPDPYSNPDSGLSGTPRDPHKIVCVGRMDRTKGQDILIQAVTLLKQRSSVAFEVDFIGDGVFRVECTRLAQTLEVADRCHFLGTLGNGEVIRRMAGAAMCIVPSRQEAFGYVNIEAMSVSTPVIGSRVGGIVEIIRDGIDGYLFPSEDAEALADKIGRLLSDADLREKMGADARQHFLADFVLSAVAIRQAAWLE